MGEITEEDVQNSLSELERNALERRKRLKNIRAQLSIRNQENGTSEAVNTEDQERDGEQPHLLFRSYQPSSIIAPNIDSSKEQMNSMEQNVSDQLKVSHEIVIDDALDINTLAPRKVDWDLKRGIQDKLQKLEHRTQKAITQLIRNNSIVKSIRNIIEVNNLGQRLESGNPELLNAAINQAMASDFK